MVLTLPSKTGTTSMRELSSLIRLHLPEQRLTCLFRPFIISVPSTMNTEATGGRVVIAGAVLHDEAVILREEAFPQRRTSFHAALPLTTRFIGGTCHLCPCSRTDRAIRQFVLRQQVALGSRCGRSPSDGRTCLCQDEDYRRASRYLSSSKAFVHVRISGVRPKKLRIRT